MSTPSKTTKPIIEDAPERSARLSWVWIIPLLALLIALGAVWKNYTDRGPLITISFDDAGGIIAGETKLKYRKIDVGLVEDLTFSEDLTQVLAHVRLNTTVADYVDASSEFWVVSPKVTTRGVSGLETILGGVYIEGSWDEKIGPSADAFVGLTQAPSAPFGAEGLRIVLRSVDGKQISEGTPVLYKGIEVGRIESPRLSPSGDAVFFDAFIEAPYDQLVTTATRFWDASGFSLSFGAGGAKVDIESIAALVSGGVSFETLVSGGRIPTERHRFDLFESEDAVRNDLFAGSTGKTLPYAIIFEDNVSGLVAGAPVEFRGIKIGEVTSLSAEFVDGDEDIADIRLIAKVGLSPEALGLPPRATEDITTLFLTAAVDAGLRARLATASLLTGGLKVELLELDNAQPASMTQDVDGLSYLPSVEAEIEDAQASAEGMFRRINALPIEELISSTIGLLNSMNGIANDPALKDTPAEIVGLVRDARQIVSTEQVREITEGVNAILADLRQASADLAAVTSQLSDEALVAELRGAITGAAEIVRNVNDATVGLPAIATQIEALAANASELPLEALVASTSKLVETVDEIAGSEAMAEVPPALSAALVEIRKLTQNIQSAGLVENAAATFASTQEAAASVEVALQSLPALITQLNRAARQAEATLSEFGESSRFSSETRETLREIQEAADAVTSLARTIERRPSSLITGR